MSATAPRQPVVIVQKTPSSSSSSVASTQSTTSSQSSNTSTSSAPQHDASQTRPARKVGEDGLEYVETGRPQGGNPHGGPPQNKAGYFRITKSTVTIHNSGGQLMGSVSTDLGEAYANGLDHTDQCRKMSRQSENTSLCFCPACPGP